MTNNLHHNGNYIELPQKNNEKVRASCLEKFPEFSKEPVTKNDSVNFQIHGLSHNKKYIDFCNKLQNQFNYIRKKNDEEEKIM